VHDSLIGPYLLPRWLSAQFYCVFLEGKQPEMLEEMLLALRRNMWFRHNGAVAHFADQVQEHLISTYSDCWIGWGGPVAWPSRSLDLTPMDSSYRTTLKLWFSHCQLILKRILLPVLLRQQQPSGSNLAFLSHTSISAASLLAAYRDWWLCVSTFILNWYEIQLFFRILQWLCLISILSQTHFDGQWHCKDACLTCSCLTINLNKSLFWSLLLPHKF